MLDNILCMKPNKYFCCIKYFLWRKYFLLPSRRWTWRRPDVCLGRGGWSWLWTAPWRWCGRGWSPGPRSPRSPGCRTQRRDRRLKQVTGVTYISSLQTSILEGAFQQSFEDMFWIHIGYAPYISPRDHWGMREFWVSKWACLYLPSNCNKTFFPAALSRTFTDN